MAEIKYEVTKTLGALAEPVNGYAKELNLVSWNDRPAVYDIRPWNESHERMGKGITLNKEEIKALKELLNKIELD